MTIDLSKYAALLYPEMVQDAPQPAPKGKDYGFGARADGSFKGPGFLGKLKRPDGDFSTEISIGVEMDGAEVEIPTLVPTLTKKEREHLLKDKEPTKAIVDKAIEHARKRMAEGKSPFFGVEDEEPAK